MASKMKTRSLFRKILLIHWWDAVTDVGWQSSEDAEKLITEKQEHLVWSLGVIVRENIDYVYLAGDWGTDDDYNRIAIIPRGMIQSTKVVGRWKCGSSIGGLATRI